MDFQNFMKIEFCLRLYFLILIAHKPYLGCFEVQQKNWADRFSRLTFIGYKHANTLTDKQSYRKITYVHSFNTFRYKYLSIWSYLDSNALSFFVRNLHSKEVQSFIYFHFSAIYIRIHRGIIWTCFVYFSLF